MYVSKIPGTKYHVSLESENGVWFLRLKLDEVVEAEEEVKQMNSKMLNDNLGSLIRQVNLPINSFQQDLIYKDIESQITHLLLQEDSPASDFSTTSDESPKYDPRVDELLDRLNSLEGRIQTLIDRMDRLEALSN